MSLILDLLPMLEGWDILNLQGTITLNPGDTKNIPLTNSGYVKYALITTTSENTEIVFDVYKATPKFLSDCGLTYNTRPAALLTQEPPYTILFSPFSPIPYHERTRLSFSEPFSSTLPAQLSYIIAGIDIYDKEAFKKSLQEILGNPSVQYHSSNTTHTTYEIREITDHIKQLTDLLINTMRKLP